MSYFLYIDTSADKSVVILFGREGKVIARYNESKINHGKVINLMVAEIFNETGIELSQLNSVCVLNGPGSYTGLRISLSTAKGLCYAHQIPLILINKLDLMRWTSQHLGLKGNRCYMIKARENEYYSLICNENGENLLESGLFLRSELKSNCEQFRAKKTAFDGSMIHEFDELDVILPVEDSIYRLCMDKIRRSDHADLFLSEPFYMKNVHINKINKL